MPAKRRRRNGKAKQRRRRGQRGGSWIKKMADKVGPKIIPGLSKGKKYGWKAKNRNPKVTDAGKAKLAAELIIGAARGPFSLGTALLFSGQKIGTLLGTNYKMPLADPKTLKKAYQRRHHFISNQFW